MKVVADMDIPFLEGVFEPYGEVVYKKGLEISHEDVLDADALVVRTRTRCDAALLEGTSVKMVATATIGTDHIDLEYCRNAGITVANAAGCNAGGVMQYVFSALYGVAARKGIKIDGSTIGIVGVGHVGSKIEAMAEYLGFNILRCDPPRAVAEGPEGFCSLEHLLEESDVVTLHVPLDETTRGMANADFFTLMKPGAIFINAARGEVVDEQALIEASPKLGAIVIDTWNNEPDINEDLVDIADIATPHIAGYTFQGKQNGTAYAVQALARHFRLEELYDFFPAQDLPGHEPVLLDLKGKNHGEIAAVSQYNYPIFTDDFRFRMEPHKFEKLRSEYQYRREIIFTNTITNMFTKEDIAQIEQRGSSVQTAEQQVERFKQGFPWMKIVAPATPERGIQVLDEAAVEAAAKYYDGAKINGKCKFVPASGAASRMFKDLFSGLDALKAGKELADDAPAAKFVDQIQGFAFYTPELFGEQTCKCPEYRQSVLSKTLTEEGLGYGAKPKGVLKFHKYTDGEIRTAFAEHLVEAQNYMRNEDGTANLVVTISPEHQHLFEEAYAQVKEAYEAKYGVKYNITFTFQDKATDTIAVDVENKPFRTETDSLLFRPAGHGALIYNLNKIEEEVVSIKNIDNVANERLLPETATWKKVLLGKALELRDKIYGYLNALDAEATPALCDEIEAFLDNTLCVTLPEAADFDARVAAIRAKLNRPIRVAGMVKNQGEPGGGPFIIADKDGSTSLQVLESVQINMSDDHARNALASATHFNPVDIVCCLHDYKGQSFDLLQYVDEDAGFISSKSYQGRELKALELPGLWNGAMSNWNTLFVEVPLATFNPVKVVLDLLRPAHQN
jgi:phosphoglycerate dehydrogenase-like enzyme